MAAVSSRTSHSPVVPPFMRFSVRINMQGTFNVAQLGIACQQLVD